MMAVRYSWIVCLMAAVLLYHEGVRAEQSAVSYQFHNGAILYSNEQAIEMPDESGELSVITYNIAGVPNLFSKATPSASHTYIGSLLSHYDLAFVQEDFAYPKKLRAENQHPYRTKPDRFWGLFQDGLANFSHFPMDDEQGMVWHRCHGVIRNGADCLAYKGFLYSRIWVTAKTSVDIYNIHFEAGQTAKDRRAREHQVRQLLHFMERNSSHNAFIVAGDTNLNLEEPDAAELLKYFQTRSGLTSSCDAMTCAQDYVDRIFVRSGGNVKLEILSNHIPKKFVDSLGEPLSDHLPVASTVRWKIEHQPVLPQLHLGQSITRPCHINFVENC